MTGDASTALRFLQALYPEGVSPHHLLIWTVRNNQKRSDWFTSIEEAARFTATTSSDAVFFGFGLSPKDFGPHARCKADAIVALPGLVCDLDIASPAHQKPGLPSTMEEAHRILPAEFRPTLIVDSGHGCHAYWLFKEPWIFEAAAERERAAALSQRWHNLLARRAETFGFALDSVFDLTRLLRLPGTMNRKILGDVRECRITAATGPRYNPSNLEERLESLGIPEIEVRTTDDRGRIVFGALQVNPGVELTAELKQRLDALFEMDSDFAAVWTRRKRMPKDGTWSGYAQSIANRLALTGFSDQQIIDLLTIHRRKFGDPGKTWPKPLSWFSTTIAKARSSVAEQERLDSKRREWKERKEAAASAEADERSLIAEVSTDQSKARDALHRLLEIDIKRVVQIGSDIEPAYRLETQDGVVHIPSLAAMTSFAAVNRYVWRYLRTALPGKAKRSWRAVTIALGKLIEIEDIGLGSVEMLLSDLYDYFATANRRMFKRFPPDEYPEGPPEDAYIHTGDWALTLVENEAEYRMALQCLSLPQKRFASIRGIYWPDDDTRQITDAECTNESSDAGRVIFKFPPLYDYLQNTKKRKFEEDQLKRRLVEAGFKYLQTASECGIRLKRVWKGQIADCGVDERLYKTDDERHHEAFVESLSRPVNGVQ